MIMMLVRLVLFNDVGVAGLGVLWLLILFVGGFVGLCIFFVIFDWLIEEKEL